MNRSIPVLFFLCLLFALNEEKTEGQIWKMRRYEAVAGFGPSMFFGDVGGFSKTENILGIRDLSFLQTRFNFNVNLKYRLTQQVNVRLSSTFGFLHASDEKGSNEGRDFEASTTIFEPALLGEYYFIKNKSEDSYLFGKGRGQGLRGFFGSLDFYFFSGIGGLSYTVKPNDKLDAFGYEPGGFTAVIPVGLGTSLIYSPDFSFGVELGGRYSFSDNLDGYTSQYSSSNDVYYFLNFTVTYKLKTGPKGLPSFR